VAYIRDYTVTEVITASANPQAQVAYPVHQTNDVILLMLAVDEAVVPSLPSGYTDIQNQAGAAQAFRLCYKVAASSSETCPALSVTSNEWHIVVIAVAGADFADPINFSGERTVTDAAAPFTWTSSLSTDENNVLIFQFCNSDAGLALTALPNYTNLVNGDSGACGVGVAYTFQPTSGPITDCIWTGRANDDTTACAVGINDDGNGTRPGYSAPASVGTYISALGGTSLIESDTNPGALTFGAIGMRPFSQFWEFNGTATWTDDTIDINDVGTADVTLTNAIGAIWYFGYDYKFDHMVLNRSTASSGGTTVWEYYNGSTWATLTVTGALTATGWVRLNWTRPTDWTSTSVNGSASRFWVRFRVTATFTTAPALTSGAVGGWLTTYDAVANVADAGVNPYNDVISLSPAQTTNFSGSERQFGTAKDMDTGIVILHHKAVAARDYAVDPTINDVTYPVTEIANGYGGYVVVFGDASGFYEAYSIHAKQSLTADYNGYNVAAIGINNSAERYGTYGGTLNKSAVTRMLFLPQGQNGALAAYVSGLSLVSEVVFAGGDSTNPLDVSDLRQIANKCVGTNYLFLGTGDFNRIYAPIQFGGSHEIKTLVDGAIFQFPTKFDGKKYLDWNAADNVAGVSFYGLGSGDWLKFPNCTWKGSQPYRWEFDASHSASTVMDFTGNTVIGATVTLQSTVTLSDIKFQSCPTFTLNSANISEATFVGTTVTAGSPGSADNITDSSFTSSGTGHAMVITGTAADLTLTNLTFTGYAGTDGNTGNEAIYFNIASGTINLTIDGGTNPSVRTAGATINKITNPVTTSITVTDITTGAVIQDARVLVYASNGSGPLPFEETVTITRSGSTATVSHTGHGITNGKKVMIKGATQQEYNGVFTITFIDANSYSYTVSGSPATPATGTIKATGVVLEGLTNVSGIISDTQSFTSNQPITGRARKATTGTKYKTGSISGTVSNTTGFSTTVQMIRDE